MADPTVKHIEMVCMNSLDPKEPCKAAAFVQVLIVEDQALQKKIDARANQKLREALDKEHREGLHDGR